MKQHNKTIYAIDTIIIIASIITILIIIGYANPQVTGPINNFETKEQTVLFNVENADYIFIDENKEFTTPKRYEVKENLEIHLTPGTYYWKATGILESSIRELTIISEISLGLKKINEETYEVINTGNEELEVELYKEGYLEETITLKPGNNKETTANYIKGEKT
jgi:hypothetical protein